MRLSFLKTFFFVIVFCFCCCQCCCTFYFIFSSFILPSLHWNRINNFVYDNLITRYERICSIQRNNNNRSEQRRQKNCVFIIIFCSIFCKKDICIYIMSIFAWRRILFTSSVERLQTSSINGSHSQLFVIVWCVTLSIVELFQIL